MQIFFYASEFQFSRSTLKNRRQCYPHARCVPMTHMCSFHRNSSAHFSHKIYIGLELWHSSRCSSKPRMRVLGDKLWLRETMREDMKKRIFDAIALFTIKVRIISTKMKKIYKRSKFFIKYIASIICLSWLMYVGTNIGRIFD